MIAALYVQKNGTYYGIPDVEPWDETRDARKYPGPWPVVAHPPCARWGKYWFGGPGTKKRFRLGDDGGCFKAALQSVQAHGGVLEHPSESKAWRAFGLALPVRTGGWDSAGFYAPGWVCHVEQGHYGHRAYKATWLYAVSPKPGQLLWGRAEATEERVRAGRVGVCQLLSRKQRAATPLAFRDLLLEIARSCRGAA